MMNLDTEAIESLQSQGVTVQKFCGIPLEQKGDLAVICPNPAVGDLTVTLEDGQEVPFPVCAGHLSQIEEDYGIS